MSDSTLNRFLASGTQAERLAFTPNPATPASGPDPTYFWFETDTGNSYAWNFQTSAWFIVSTGGGAAALSITASERVVAGSMVNIWASSGAKVRNANATTSGQEANGYVLVTTATNDIATVYTSGTLSGLSLTGGSTYYLSVTNGAITATPPASAGNIVQSVGKAVSATQLAFLPGTPIQL